MSFTNDRLRIMKNVDLTQTTAIYLSHSELKALLSRLEAAERLAEHFKPKLNRMCRECEELLEAWRKSCGEAGQ